MHIHNSILNFACSSLSRGASQSDSANAYHHNHSNGHNAEHSPNSSHLSVHTEDSLIARSHKQQTTQQVTTVTKVVREVKHLGPDGQPLEYVGMPIDDGQQLDYVSMPLGIYPRSQYLNYNHMDQSGGGHSDAAAAAAHMAYVHGAGLPEAQYHAHYQDYEHYPPSAQYANSGYAPSTTGVPISGQSYLGEYGLNDHGRSGTPPSPSEQSASPLPLNVAAQPPVAYLRAPYDEMPDYRVTPSPGGTLDPRYTDDPSGLVYGYVSTSPYGTTGMNFEISNLYVSNWCCVHRSSTAKNNI